MSLAELLLGQLPEAIYFAVFMILTKQLKTKRILFIVISTIEYIILLYALPFNVWSHILYFILMYLLLKLLYKDKSQITDVFTLGIASIIMILFNFVLYFTLYQLVQNYIVYVAINHILLFMFLYIFRNKLFNIQKIYKLLWNRNDKVKKIMKSTTFRCINLVLFNFMFYFINLAMLYCIYKNIVK